MSNLSSVEVKAGDKVVGRYKRAGRNAKVIEMHVEATVVRDGVAMLVGTMLDLANGGQRVAVRASAFDPREFKAAKYDEPVKIDLDAVYITASSDSFSFVEEVEERDREWARMLDGQPCSELVCASVFVTVVKAE